MPPRSLRARWLDASSTTTRAPLRATLDVLRVLVAVLIVFNISRVHQHFGLLAVLRPGAVLIALIVAYAFLVPRSLAPRTVLSTYPARVVAGLGAMAVLSAPLGISLGHSASFLVDSYWKVLLGMALVMLALRHARDLKSIVWAVVVSSACLAWLALFVYQTSDLGGLERLSEGYTYDANDLGCVIVLSIPIVLLAFQHAGAAGKVACTVVLLGLGMALARTGSRGAFLGLVAVGATLLLMTNSIAVVKRVVFVAMVGIGLALSAPAGYWKQMLTISSPTEDYNWTSPIGRRAVAERGVAYMLSRPVAGIGIGNFAFAEGTISDRARAHVRGDEGIKWSAAHNSFVQAGAELGVPGLVLFCMLVVGTAVRLARLRRRLPAEWRVARSETGFLYGLCTFLPVSLAGFAVSGFFVSFAYVDVLYILVALCAGAESVVVRRLAMEGAVAEQRAPTVRMPSGRRGGLFRPELAGPTGERG